MCRIQVIDLEKGIIESPFKFTGDTICGEGLKTAVRTLADLKGIFADEAAYEAMDKDTLAYRVASIEPDAQGTPGGLYMGITYLAPGKVGKEYFMTKGHFHARRETAEYYWGVAGEGALILMDENGECRWERVFPGSVHYIPGNVAHRLANTGTDTLRVGACWPSDAGHDYATIAASGFTKRLFKGANGPELR